jgi:hypothetical protein
MWRPWGRSEMRKLALLMAVALVVACSAFEPDVGPVQGDGSSASACSLGASGYGTSYGAPNGQAAIVDFCTVDGGTIDGLCDTCEVANCCAERVACYSDQTCSCADEALDPCLSAVPADAASPDGESEGGLSAATSSALAACWSAFTSSGSIGQARYECLRVSCREPCQIPD